MDRATVVEMVVQETCINWDAEQIEAARLVVGQALDVGARPDQIIGLFVEAQVQVRAEVGQDG